MDDTTSLDETVWTLDPAFFHTWLNPLNIERGWTLGVNAENVHIYFTESIDNDILGPTPRRKIGIELLAIEIGIYELWRWLVDLGVLLESFIAAGSFAEDGLGEVDVHIFGVDAQCPAAFDIERV